MLNQINFAGHNKIEMAISRLQMYEPPEGYYLAFSGGKDSIVVKELCNMAGVKYDAHYNVTSVDPPELIWYMKEHHPDVKFEYPRYKDGKVATMWNLIPRKMMPPTRLARYCCDILKEGGGAGRFTLTGVRWAESSKRRNNRAGLELGGANKRILSDPDNPENEPMARTCPTKGKHILNPIIDWEDEDVWEFIRLRNLPYCCLYDQGYTRLGCIGCPMNHDTARKDLKRYPKHKQAYIRAFGRMVKARHEAGKDQDSRNKWGTAEDVMKWWLRE